MDDVLEVYHRANFIHISDGKLHAHSGFLNLLSQSRNYGLVLAALANQYLGQMSDELKMALLGNAANVLSLRCGADDAPTCTPACRTTTCCTPASSSTPASEHQQEWR